MRFIITTKDPSHAYKSWQENWPDKLHNINARSFEKSFNRTEYEKLRLNWVVNKYLGKAPERGFTFSYQGIAVDNDYCIPTISIQSVATYLENLPIIDNEYIPEKGDELQIYLDYQYKEIIGLKRPDIDFHTISLIYKETQWEKGNYDFDCYETLFYLRGIIAL